MKYPILTTIWALAWLLCIIISVGMGQETASGVSTSTVSSGNGTETTPADNETDEDDDGNEGEEKTFYDYEDYDAPDASGNQTQARTGTIYTWAKWPKWSKCSRNCGGGVQTRIRNCIEIKHTRSEAFSTEFIPGTNGRKGCFGVFKKYRMCNLKVCANGGSDFRDQQCAAYNEIPYKDTLYYWEGYAKEDHECELNCKPVNLLYYRTLKKSVIDGTPCTRPAVYYTHNYRGRAVCVEGICKAVHKSGAIRGATTNDVKTRCGSVLCRTISEIFGKATLPHGYFYVTTIGTGASNITIKQMAASENQLALRSVDNKFIINGNNHVSETGTYEYHGDAYDYDKDLQTVEAKGPIKKAIDVLLLVRGVNPGVKYDYNIPVATASITESEETDTHWNDLGVPVDDVDDNKIPENLDGQVAKIKDRKKRKFSWKLLGFGPCNRSCGAGVRQPIFRCIKDSPTRFYTPRRCMFIEKPVFNENIYKCNLQLCPAYWQTEEFGECVCTDGVGEHSRVVKCVQEQPSGLVEVVDDAQCTTTKPEESGICDCPKKIRRKIYAQRSDKSARIYSRLIGSSASVYNSFNQTLGLRKRFRDDRDRSGVWLMSDWNDECSANCGSGLEHRSIYCDRTAPYTDLCDLRFTPELSRPCDKSKHCTEGVWFTSPWSNCTGDCFNLIRKRNILCILDGIVVEDENCDQSEKPVESKNCTHREVSYCGAKWHYSEWSECSRSCGEGIQRRYAKCLEFDWKESVLQESNNCKYVERQPVYGTCNTQKCDEIDPQVDSLQNDLASTVCADEVPNCKRINKSRLCKLHYYQKNCCLSCKGF